MFCALLSSCQTPTKKNNDINLETDTTIIAKDSLVNGKVIIKSDTTKTNTSTHSDKQTTTVNSANSSNKQLTKAKPVPIKRIEHGSDNQSKLDSIKKAKGKLKK